MEETKKLEQQEPIVDAAAPLPEESLEQVVGGAAGSGKIQMNDFHFVKKVDKASA